MDTSNSVTHKRKQFSIVEKIEIIDKIKAGQSRTSIIKEFGVPEGTLRGWLKDEEKLRTAISEMTPQTRNANGLRVLMILNSIRQ
ncbi:hypothetical protein DPMN_035641 [Dreissena polymorpha]|uniref:HTH psq-type domain-containing protein n=1 Tax=Dreissena polymorpha TaxID=45954 RepID=A0A9D4M9Z1_DREPO|nr:hypothetical protein DPMN_035641 [Dreissena polymorpha]